MLAEHVAKRVGDFTDGGMCLDGGEDRLNEVHLLAGGGRDLVECRLPLRAITTGAQRPDLIAFYSDYSGVVIGGHGVLGSSDSHIFADPRLREGYV